MCPVMPSSNWCRAELLERCREICGNGLGGATFDLVAMNEMDDLAVSQQRHRRTARLIFREILPCSRDGVQILAGKHRDDLLRHYRMFEGQRKSRPGIAGGAPANGVHENEHLAPLISQCCIDLIGSGQFSCAEPGDFCSHRGNQCRIVRHQAFLM